ncbi:hypothetical protein FPOAC1_007562 [Fusarium poae]|uniref:hypothetical protein n=1 Tax=Fusarium poae TaxID=36050 RepID=UPI001CE82E23|nr:hypothetical protein FPOAC1_007562 [Fusarium poae]KAG8668185.1 hypothetical protein FPOAC1_007562 [Fusarium poae]
MVQPRLRTRWSIVLKTIAIILLPLLFGFLLRYVVDNIPSHPAWVTESLEITPLSIPLAKPISYIYREWTDAFLPLLIQIPLPFEHNGQASVAYLDGMLYLEINRVYMGLYLWKTSQVPGPDPSVLEFFKDAKKAAPEDLDDHPEKFGYRLLQGEWVLWFVHFFETSPTIQQKINHCALLWKKVRDMNLEALENLKKLDERYSWLDTAGAALLQVRQEWELPSPHHDHWWYPFLAKDTSMLDMLDSINFTVTRLIPWIQPNRLLVTQAIKKLEHLNDVIEAEKKTWDTVEAGGGVVVDDVLSPGSTRWIWNTKRVIKSWDRLAEWELTAMVDEWEASYNRVEADDLERPRFPRRTRPSKQPKEKPKWWWFYD